MPPDVLGTGETMDLCELLARWSRVGGRASSTAKKYGERLRRLAEAGIRSPRDVTRATVAAYVDDRRAAGRSVSTVNGELNALSTVLGFAERGAEDQQVERLEKQRREIRALKLPEPPQEDPPLALDQREWLVGLEAAHGWVHLLFALGPLVGLRVSELVELRTEDWDRASRTIVVRHAKGRRPRAVSLCPDAERILEREAPPAGWLFPSSRHPGQHVATNTVRSALLVISRPVGRRLSPHQMRRAFATWALRQGVPAPVVARQLGHHDLRLVMRHYERWAVGHDEAMDKLRAPATIATPAQTQAPPAASELA